MFRGDGTVRLPGVGTVRIKGGFIFPGEPRSFQIADKTRKVTAKITDATREFELCVQFEVPQPEADRTKPAKGMDLGVANLAATTDSGGNERLWNVSGGCRRHDGDGIDMLKSRRSRYGRGSRRWKKIGRHIRRESRKIRNRQIHEETRIARAITDGIGRLFREDLNFASMRRSNGHSGKTGLNREMGYSRIGTFASHVGWQAKKAGVPVGKVDPRRTSITCFACGFTDKRSRNGPDFACTFCGWHNHADKNAAGTILLIGCLPPGTGGKAHYHSGRAIAGANVVVRREDRNRQASCLGKGRLEPGSDFLKGSGRASKRVIVLDTGYG